MTININALVLAQHARHCTQLLESKRVESWMSNTDDFCSVLCGLMNR